MKHISLLFLSTLIVVTLCALQACSSDDEDPKVVELIVSDFTASVDESPQSGQVIGTLSVTSSETTLSYAITAEAPAGAIAVNSASGEVTVANPALFVFATNPTITATVVVSAGTVSENANVTINVNEPDEQEPIIWSGEKITFTKDDNADPEMEANQDRITDNVWLTRANNGGPIYNIKVEAFNDNGPSGTEWAEGTIDQLSSLTFANLREALGGNRGGFKALPGKTLVLHLLEDDIYLEVTFNSWSSGQLGGFSYDRSTE